MVDRRNHPGRDEYVDVVDIPCDMAPLGLKSAVMHRICLSMVFRYDSLRSKDAATLRPRYSSRNQYSLINRKERCGDLVSRTCFAGIRSTTNHSDKKSSMILNSRSVSALRTAARAISCWGIFLRCMIEQCVGHIHRRKKPSHFGDPLAGAFHVDGDLSKGPGVREG